MQIGNSKVKRILVGDKVVYRDSDGWIPLELPDGVNGLVLFRDKGDGTAELTGSLEFSTTAKIYTTFSPGHLILTPPQGYQFTETNWRVDTENKDKMCIYHSRSDSGVPVMFGDAYLQFSDGNVSFSQVVNGDNVNGTQLVLVSFNQANTSTPVTAEDGALPAIINIERV